VALRDAALAVVLCSVLSVATNAIRNDGLPLVQREEYQLLVPCPEVAGDASAVSPDTSLLRDPRVLIVDARSAPEFAQWHVTRATNIPFDYLEPTPRETIRRIASSGAREILVYGDGDDPDSGEQLARELSGKGVRNIHFVTGGAPAIVAATRQGTAP